MRTITLAAAVAALAFPALADEQERVPPVADPLVKAECGSCHMAFQPAFLPKSSWRATMAGLADHFGEDASLPEETRRAVEAYYIAAAPEDRRLSRMLRVSSAPPLRITELRWWRHEHDEDLRPEVWARQAVGSPANCPACHLRAEAGSYDEDEIRVPR